MVSWLEMYGQYRMKRTWIDTYKFEMVLGWWHHTSQNKPKKHVSHGRF